MYTLLGTWVNTPLTTSRAGLFCDIVSLPSFKGINRLNGKMTRFLVYFREQIRGHQWEKGEVRMNWENEIDLQDCHV